MIQPGGLLARVRGLQVHGTAVESAPAGQRVAVNLARVPVRAIERGDVLATAGAVKPAFVIDAELDHNFPTGSRGPPGFSACTTARGRPWRGLGRLQTHARSSFAVGNR